ncbi:MAG: sigma 54-interacting transcriptional regulator [Lachnospiraceae bacterium]|nr:sigma 54-interacting transcriptional regulator [Lachnospiraceae bacterium]
MVKIALLVPTKKMLEIARGLMEEMEIDAAYIKAIESAEAVQEAREAVAAGAHILIARGYQAKLIREYTNIPLVEIRLHAQEIGLLIRQAKKLVKKDHPVIGLIAYENMLCDLSHMGELLDVELAIRYLSNMEDTIPSLRELSRLKPDLIIGGEITCREAEKMGYPSLLFSSSEESLREALLTAKGMAYAAEAEMQNAAQFETVLDTSFGGIIKINRAGTMIVINKLVENLLGKSAEEVVGLPLERVFPEFDREAVEKILSGKRENYTVSVTLQRQAWMLMMAPIQYDGRVTGAILSLYKVHEGTGTGSTRQQNPFLSGFTARDTFQTIYTENALMKKALERAREYALSDSPVLLYGEAGTEYLSIAQAIHNNSARKSGPFLSLDVGALEKEQQAEAFFGSPSGPGGEETRRRGALARANHGTLFIQNVGQLTLPVQHQLGRILQGGFVTRTDALPLDSSDVRIIGFSEENLLFLVKTGKFCQELFYLLQGLTVEIPHLKQRPEDLVFYFNRFFQEYSRKYNKHLTLTAGAYECLKNLVWRGNLLQLRAFCERLVLEAEKRRVDQGLMERLYGELYPSIRERAGEKEIVVYKSPQAAKLSAVLERHRGNRQLAAQELGISTTTLWRRMKKYGIEANYEKA